MARLLNEDDKTFTFDADDGNGPQQTLKTPQMMAPGGIYDQLKQASQQPDVPAPSAGFGAPPPSNPPQSSAMPTPAQIGQPQPTVPAGATGSWTDTPSTSSVAAGASGDISPVPTPQQQPQQQMPLSVPLTSSQTQVQSNMVNPTYANGLQQAVSDEGSAVKKEGEINADLQKGLADVAGEKKKIHGDMADVDQQKVDQIKQTYDQFQQNIVKQREDLAKQQIKPKSIFGDSIGSGIMAGLALALGAMGSALTGKENAGLKVIQDKINQDLEVQKYNTEKKSRDLNDLGVAYKAALDMGMSEKDAAIHVKAYGLNQAADQAEQLAAASGSDLAKANAEKTAAALRASAQGELAKLSTTTVSKTSATQDTPVSKLMGKLPEISGETKKKLEDHVSADRGYRDIAEAYDVAYGKGLTGPLDNRLQSLAKTFGLQAKDSADLQQQLQVAFSQRAHELFGSRFTEPEAGQLEKIMPNANERSEIFRSKLHNLWQKNANDYQDILNQYKGQRDYTPVQLHYNRLNPSNTTFQPQ